MFGLLILVRNYLRKNEKKISVKIAIANVIAKPIYTYMKIKTYVIATTVNVNNYASIKTF
tara:strand:+ start:305 stop:484 length:180 start_codon:yes stop_codon:yes gene_type:complete